MAHQTWHPLSVPRLSVWSHWTTCSFPNAQSYFHTFHVLILEYVDPLNWDTSSIFFTQRNFTLSSRISSSVNSSVTIFFSHSLYSRLNLILPNHPQSSCSYHHNGNYHFLILSFRYRFLEINEKSLMRAVIIPSLFLYSHNWQNKLACWSYSVNAWGI